jgi:signal transduction histidine kinase
MKLKIRTVLLLGALFTIVLGIATALTLAAAFLRGVGGQNGSVVVLVAVFLGIVALLMSGALYAVGNRMAERIRMLEDAAHGIGAGDLARRVRLEGGDEVSEIAKVFDEMVANLQRYVDLIPRHESLQSELERMREVVGVLRNRNMDISESLQRLRRAQEQFLQKERSTALGKMFASVGGDLAAALNEIRRTAEHALEAAGAGAFPLGELAAIRDASAKALEKLGRFTAYCLPPRAGQLESVDLAELVQETIQLTESKWKADAASGRPGIRVENRVERLPPLRGHRADLIQMLTHLVCNAAEAMPHGGTLSFTAAAHGGTITLAVRDSGAGMADATVRRCFLPFFSTKEGAAGIGLSVAQGIVQQHGGKIGIESQPGAGATVFVELPLAGRRLQADEDESAPRPGRPLAVLLVEDDRWTLDSLSRGLTADGHRVETAVNAGEVADKLTAGGYDVVITDRAMPDISGEEVAAEAKRHRAEQPVIMLTGFGALMREKGERPRDVDLVLGKPVSASELRRALARVTVS